jgi:hypothetical protein
MLAKKTPGTPKGRFLSLGIAAARSQANTKAVVAS